MKLNIKVKGDYFIFTNAKKGVLKLHKYLPKVIYEKSYRSFFRGYHIDKGYYGDFDKQILDKLTGTDEDINEFVLYYNFAKSYLNYNTRVKTFSGLLEKYFLKLESYNLSEDFTLKEMSLEYANYLKSGVLLSDDIYLRKKFFKYCKGEFKLRKDILRITHKSNIKLDETFLEYYYKDKEFLYSLILILDDLQVYEELDLSYCGYEKSLYYLLKDNRFYSLYTLGYPIKSIIEMYLNYFSVYENFNLKSYLNFLMDYANMMNLMGISKYKRFPKYLKSIHDITTIEFNLFKKNYDEEIFKKQVREDLFFEYFANQKEDKNFIVEIPQKTEDLKFEGKKLNHCVGSYIDRVITGKTQIVFLRKEKQKPLITLEIKDDRIIQAKGESNRNLFKHEYDYLKIYARHKNLQIKV